MGNCFDMANDRTATAPDLNLISSERKPRTMTATEREAFDRGRAAAERAMMRERFGAIDFIPQPPFPLTDVARRHWDQGLRGIPTALRKPGCEDALARFAIAMETIERSTTELNRMGLLIEGRQGAPVKNPVASIRASAMTQVERARRELGLVTSWVERAQRAKGRYK